MGWDPPQHGHPTHKLGIYALGGLSPADEQTTRRHLENCSLCRAQISDLEGVAELLSAAELVPDIPPGLAARILTTHPPQKGPESAPLSRTDSLPSDGEQKNMGEKTAREKTSKEKVWRDHKEEILPRSISFPENRKPDAQQSPDSPLPEADPSREHLPRTETHRLNTKHPDTKHQPSSLGPTMSSAASPRENTHTPPEPIPGTWSPFPLAHSGRDPAEETARSPDTTDPRNPPFSGDTQLSSSSSGLSPDQVRELLNQMPVKKTLGRLATIRRSIGIAVFALATSTLFLTIFVLQSRSPDHALSLSTNTDEISGILHVRTNASGSLLHLEAKDFPEGIYTVEIMPEKTPSEKNVFPENSAISAGSFQVVKGKKTIVDLHTAAKHGEFRILSLHSNIPIATAEIPE